MKLGKGVNGFELELEGSHFIRRLIVSAGDGEG